MEGISKNVKQTPESVKFPLEVREGQNKGPLNTRWITRERTNQVVSKGIGRS